MRKTRHILHSIALLTLATLFTIGVSASGESPGNELEPAAKAGEATAGDPITGDEAGLPDTPVGALVARYVEAYNSNDDKAMSAFIASSFDEVYRATKTDQEHLDVYRMLYDQHFGSIKVHRVIQQGGTGLAVLFRTEKGPMAEFIFTFGPGTPKRISGIRVAVVDVDQDP